MSQQTAYIFPGQGSQSVGMGQALVDRYTQARDTFAEADAVLGFSLSALCGAGPAETLTETINAQPAILTTSIAAWRALRAGRPNLPPPLCVAGHSLGEYSALVVAGALDFADAVRLTRRRGELMAQAGASAPGSMAAILKLDDAQVAEICVQASQQSGAIVQVANYNAPGQVVISGEQAGVAAAAELAKAARGRAMPLAVSIAAHSALMASATAAFAEAVAATPFRLPSIPIIANITAQPLPTVAALRAELVGQLTHAVQWTASVQAMVALGATHFVECGSGEVLTGLMKRIAADVTTANIRTPDDIEGQG